MPHPRQMGSHFPHLLLFLQAAQGSPCCHFSSLFMTQMNFMSRNGVLEVPAWCPPQENVHCFGCTMNQMLPMALFCSPIPAASWDMPGSVKVSFSSGQTPNFPLSGQLGRKSDQQQRSQSSGQVTAGEQEPDGAGVSVPLPHLLSCTFPLGTLPCPQWGRIPPGLTELGRLSSP